MKQSIKNSSNKPLKVGLVFDDSLDRSDGVQQQLKLLGTWLKHNGHKVVYLVGETTMKEYRGIPVRSLSRNLAVSANQNQLTLPLPAKADKIRRVMDKEQFDVLHVMLPFSPFLGRSVVREALKNQIPLVGTFHTHPASFMQAAGSWIYGRWLKRYLKRFSHLISVSEPTRQYVRRDFGVDSQVLPNFIDIDRFKNGKPLPRLKDGKLTIMYLNRLAKRKGPQHLIRAYALLKQQSKLKNTQLVIVGKGPISPELSSLAAELKLTGDVLMPGFIDEKDKADYLASADLVVYPATGGEAFGIVLLEAMAAGSLTLGGDNPGYRSVLGAQNEQLVDATNHAAMASRISKLLTDKKLRTKLLNWQKQAIKQYDVAVIVPKIVKLYRERR